MYYLLFPRKRNHENVKFGIERVEKEIKSMIFKSLEVFHNIAIIPMNCSGSYFLINDKYA